MTWREQPDGTYLSDSAPYVATPIGGGDYSLSCLDPKEDKRFLSFSEILQAPFFPVPIQFRLDDGTAFAIKFISFTLGIGVTNLNVPHGVPNLISNNLLIGATFMNITNLGGSSDRVDYSIATNVDTPYRLAFSNTDATVVRGTATTSANAKALMFYKV
ncbi:hypothetical protein AB3N61_09275 [Leptospira sp. WS58.C1]|uniref:hypothetical protein n=1 Tax=Leptospira cinconiae TaxID=3235173 RepID=UPI00349E610B